jgi:tellurite methyltransferase
MSQEDRDKWNSRYRARDPSGVTSSAFLRGLDPLLPRTGRALDVAGGAGQNALWLAQRGLEVTLVDIAEEGLSLARAAAAATGAGVALETVAADLEEQPLPVGPFDVITCFNFLRRALFADIPARLTPGGLFVFLQPTRTNIERNPRPPAPFLLDDGELPSLIAGTGLSVLSYEEGWFDDGAEGPRHEARLCARRR